MLTTGGETRGHSVLCKSSQFFGVAAPPPRARGNLMGDVPGNLELEGQKSSKNHSNHGNQSSPPINGNQGNPIMKTENLVIFQRPLVLDKKNSV